MDLAHAERRKKSVGQLRCKESESGMVVAIDASGADVLL